MNPQPNKDEKARTHEARLNTAREVRAARAAGAGVTPKAAGDAPPLEYGDPPRAPMGREGASPKPTQTAPPETAPKTPGASPRNV
jgi:hypothetical protein